MAHMNRLCRTSRGSSSCCLEVSDEMQMNTVTQQATQKNPEKPKATGHYCRKNQVPIKTSAVNLNEKKSKAKTVRIVLAIAKTMVVR